jgi:hypothetical protein
LIEENIKTDALEKIVGSQKILIMLDPKNEAEKKEGAERIVGTI